jgi:hypothetical protein
MKKPRIRPLMETMPEKMICWVCSDPNAMKKKYAAIKAILASP